MRRSAGTHPQSRHSSPCPLRPALGNGLGALGIFLEGRQKRARLLRSRLLPFLLMMVIMLPRRLGSPAFIRGTVVALVMAGSKQVFEAVVVLGLRQYDSEAGSALSCSIRRAGSPSFLLERLHCIFCMLRKQARDARC